MKSEMVDLLAGSKIHFNMKLWADQPHPRRIRNVRARHNCRNSGENLRPAQPKWRRDKVGRDLAHREHWRKILNKNVPAHENDSMVV